MVKNLSEPTRTRCFKTWLASNIYIYIYIVSSSLDSKTLELVDHLYIYIYIYIYIVSSSLDSKTLELVDHFDQAIS
jgi:hypothetical protein